MNQELPSENPRELKNYHGVISFRGIINSHRNAINGLKVLMHHEYNLYVQIGFALLAMVLGFVFPISPTEWMLQTVAIGLVIFAELINTAIEKVMDFVHPQYDVKVREIKDMAAGSVLFAVVIAVVIGFIIYTPYVIVPAVSLFFGK